MPKNSKTTKTLKNEEKLCNTNKLLKSVENWVKIWQTLVKKAKHWSKTTKKWWKNWMKMDLKNEKKSLKIVEN